jgi:hypothetical protein
MQRSPAFSSKTRYEKPGIGALFRDFLPLADDFHIPPGAIQEGCCHAADSSRTYDSDRGLIVFHMCAPDGLEKKLLQKK